MKTLVVGDLQGCLEPLQRLLDAAQFDPAADRLWLVGDLVNRGPDSLATLRFLKGLGKACLSVLGNHDLALLALARGHREKRPNADLRALLAAPDCDELLDWMRRQPMMHREGDIVLVHAGLPPQWTINQAISCAAELSATLASDDLDDFLSNMYGDKPKIWSEDLRGKSRLRFITNCLTRLRYCKPDGRLMLDDKGPPGSQKPPGLPWFAVPGRRSADHTILFGHWSTLGQTYWPRFRVWGLDSGYVWGGRLTALHLEQRRIIAAPAGHPHA